MRRRSEARPFGLAFFFEPSPKTQEDVTERSKQPTSGDDVRRCDHHCGSAQEYDEDAAQISAALFREQVDDQVERLPEAVPVIHAGGPQRLNSSPRSNTTALMASAKK